VCCENGFTDGAVVLSVINDEEIVEQCAKYCKHCTVGGIVSTATHLLGCHSCVTYDITKQPTEILKTYTYK